MRGADVYHGSIAANYDTARDLKPKRKAEIAAIERFVTEGPVLDVPCGTGVFIPVYQRKGINFTGVDISDDMLAIARRKVPGANLRHGSIFDLSGRSGEFKTAVCVRFLEWLPLDQAKIVIEKLQQIAGVLVVSIVHGIEGEPEAFTYDFGKFLHAVDGLLIEDRQVTARVRGMTSEIFKLRPAGFDDVVMQFKFDYPDTAADNIQRLADKFAAFFGLPSIPIREDNVTVKAEYWDGARVGKAVQILADHRFVVEDEPRHRDGPATVIERYGLPLMIDGRRRANLWKKEKGPFPVLVVRPR